MLLRTTAQFTACSYGQAAGTENLMLFRSEADIEASQEEHCAILQY
jgi:hypothetical protein